MALRMDKMAEEPVKVVLLGHTGAGKSSAGNTILGNTRFDSATAAVSQTSHVKQYQRNINGKTIILADTPGFRDTRNIDVEKIIRDFVANFKPHVFLFVITLSNRFPQEVAKTLDRIENVFGSEVYNHGIVLFTSMDYLHDLPIQEFLDHHAHGKIRDLVEKCGGRYVGFDNNAGESSKTWQVQELMNQIHTLEKVPPYKSLPLQTQSFIERMFWSLKRFVQDHKKYLKYVFGSSFALMLIYQVGIKIMRPTIPQEPEQARAEPDLTIGNV